jgi:hypothetical protein
MGATMGRIIFLAVGTILTVTYFEVAQADDSRKALSWQTYEHKDVLTDRVTHQISSEVTFPDNVKFQVFASCEKEGVETVFSAFHGAEMDPLAWQKGEIALPVFIDDSRRRDAELHAADPRANKVSILFYDPTVAKKIFDQTMRVPLGLLFKGDPTFEKLNALENEARWKKFIAATAGTIIDLQNAKTIRIRFPLVDGSGNVVDLNPQDPVLKDFVSQCIRDARLSTTKPPQR